jgi:hypothetical protein
VCRPPPHGTSRIRAPGASRSRDSTNATSGGGELWASGPAPELVRQFSDEGFRDLKSTLLLRPVFHRLEHRIRAHVLICWLALLLTRVAERASGLSWRNTNRQLGRISQVTLAGPAGSVVQTTPLSPEQKAIYQALSVQPPARITAFHPT